MALTPNNFPQALALIKAQSQTIKDLQKRVAQLEGQLESNPEGAVAPEIKKKESKQ